MRIVQVGYQQKGKVWLDDIDCGEVVMKYNQEKLWIKITLIRRHGIINNIIIIKWYN